MLVFVIDGTGSWKRGLNFEGPLKYSMGTVELQDQMLGLQDFINKGCVDEKRIVISGWSYGGYMALMGVAQYGSFFKQAISGAPVTVWEAYDTGYTERYMGFPAQNQEGYKKGSVLTYIKNFPDEQNRLLMVHGLRDENGT